MALERPGIFLFGPRRSGKTSIARVVFAKLPPHETLFLSPSAHTHVRVYTIATNPYCQFAVWDFPGDYEWARGAAPSVVGSIPSTSMASLPSTGTGLAGGGLPDAHTRAHTHTHTRSGLGLPTGVAATSTTLQASLQGRLKCLVYDDPQDDEDAMGGGGGGEAEPGDAPAGVYKCESVREGAALGAAAAVVFVINATEEQLTQDTLESLRQMGGALMALARRRAATHPQLPVPGGTHANPFALPSVDVFVHQVDGDNFANAGEEVRGEIMRDIAAQLTSELADLGFAVGGAALGTAGRPPAGVPSSGGASAAVPLSVSFHATSLFDHSVFEAMSRVVQKVTPGPQLMPSVENLLNALQHSCSAEKAFLFDVVNKLYFATDSSPVSDNIYELCADMIDVVVDVACIYDPVNLAEAAAASPSGGIADALAASSTTAAAVDAGRCSLSTIKLANGTTLYMREVAPYIAAIVVLKESGEAEDDDVVPRLAEDASALSAAHEPHMDATLNGLHTVGAAASDSTDHRAAGFLPRASLSMPQRALLDYNIGVFARALAGLFAIKFAAHSASAITAGAAASLAASYRGAGMAGAFPSSLNAAAGLPLSSSLTSAGALYGRSYGGRAPLQGSVPSMGSPGDSGIELGGTQRKSGVDVPPLHSAHSRGV